LAVMVLSFFLVAIDWLRHCEERRDEAIQPLIGVCFIKFLPIARRSARPCFDWAGSCRMPEGAAS
jgi:hypothetical protein